MNLTFYYDEEHKLIEHIEKLQFKLFIGSVWLFLASLGILGILNKLNL